MATEKVLWSVLVILEPAFGCGMICLRTFKAARVWLEGACPGVLGAVGPLNQEIARATFACAVIQQRRRRNLLKQAVCRVSQHSSGQGHEPPTDNEGNIQIDPEHCSTCLLTPAATNYII